MCFPPKTKQNVLNANRKTMQKVCVFPKQPKKLKIWYTTDGHRLAVIAGLMLVKTLFFVWFVGENTWFMQRFLDVIANILVLWGKHNGFA